MSRTSQERVDDILVAIDRCQRFIALVGVDCDDPDLIAMAEDAIERNLQIIGEAATHLPDDLTAAHPEIPWPQIRGFRNILVHQYFGVDFAVVRDVVNNHLPLLATSLRRA